VRRCTQVFAFAIAVAISPTSAVGQGLSARFGYVRAVEREPLLVRVEVEGLIEAVGEVVVQARKVGSELWHSAKAVPVDIGGNYEATFTSTVVPDRPHSIEVRARILGTRSGVLLEIGVDEPLVVEVLSGPEAKKHDEIMAPIRRDPNDATADLGLVGWVGTDTRVGSSARLRASIALGLRVSQMTEVLVHVSVGPAFARPELIAGGGPVVLGVEGGARFYTRDVRTKLWAPWLEAVAGSDLRLPGFDPGAGLRAGITWNFSADIALDASLGGMFVVYRAFDREDRSAVGGASGGVRLEARFGGGR
jgi:hypothetical protein